jgi:hypothetical protein
MAGNAYTPPTKDIFFLCHGFAAGKERVPIPAGLEVITFVKPGQIMYYPLQGYLFDLISQQHTALLSKSLKPLDTHMFSVDIGEDPNVPQVETVYVSVGHEGDQFRNLPCQFTGPEFIHLGFFDPEKARTVISDFLSPEQWLSEGQLGGLTDKFVAEMLGGDVHKQFSLLDVCTFLKKVVPDEKVRLYFFSCQEQRKNNAPGTPVAEEEVTLTLRKAMNQLKGGTRRRRQRSQRRR